MSTTSTEPTYTATQSLDLDALIIGAGVAGLYQLHQLREQGLRVRAYDAADDVGGTWYWNRYPGARFDSEAYIYQYLFSEELYKNWSWSQRFPGQPEIERWMHYVADSLDLRRDIQLSTRITSAHYDEVAAKWVVRTDQDETITTRFLVACSGMLSAPMSYLFEGQEDFSGPIFHTSRWPKEGADLDGKRVAVIGVGATGIQVIQTIADDVEHLKVFIRTPQYALPMKNPTFDESDVVAYKSRFAELKETLPTTFSGFEYDFEHVWADLTPEQRNDVLEEIYENGSLKLWLASFGEMFYEEEISEEISEFVRRKMRARLQDPHLCDLLIPTDYGFGTHRVPLETNYLEVYHRPNVEAVGVRDNPITRIVPEGIILADGTLHEVDVIVMATGFDAGTGALTRIDIRGRGGRSLKDDWNRDIRTTMGLMVHGYPNMLTTGAPLAPSAALCNMTTCLQQQTEWIAECLRYMRAHDYTLIEPTQAGEDEWVAHHDETANATLVSKTDSWYNGANVPGKPRRVLSYIGGVGVYREKTLAAAAAGYKGFQLS
ncbi:flavin-containing monooxygenase [Rhodococcus sp. NPDC060090]|uniref:flavin-containing monooxygenase n=1 Tax=Rhodococcus sp. NPDC060090 TaxID=3347056 RepID=UPI00364D3AC8